MLNPIASNLEQAARVAPEKPDSHLLDSAYGLTNDNVQSTGVLGAVDRFVHDHPYAVAAAGVVVGAGVLALTRGKIATATEVFAPLARNTKSECGLLNQTRNVLNSAGNSFAASLTRESGSLAMITAEAPGLGITSRALNIGEAVGRVPRGMLSATDSGAIATKTGSATTADAATSSFGKYGPRHLKIYIHTGEKAAVDVSKAGPLSYLKTNASETWSLPPSHEQMKVKHAFGSKINHAAGSKVGRYPFRVSPDIESPVAVLSEEGSIRSLIVPRGTTKAQLSEAMTIASNADRMFMDIAAEEATYTKTKLAPGFIQKVVEVDTRSAHEMTGYALKGSSDWVKGAPGNNYTRYLRDWHGNFTRTDRTTLHKLFSNERIPVRLFPDARTW